MRSEAAPRGDAEGRGARERASGDRERGERSGQASEGEMFTGGRSQ